MIPYSMKVCPEVVISERRLPALEEVLISLGAQYDRLVGGVLSVLPGGKAFLQERSNEVVQWFKHEFSDGLVLDLVSPKEVDELLFVLQLKPIRTLDTEWGKRHQRKQVAYLVIYGFGSSLESSQGFRQFREDLGQAIRTHFSLRHLPSFSFISRINKIYSKLENCPHTDLDISEHLLPALQKMQCTAFRNTIVRAKQAKDPTLDNIAKSTGLQVTEVTPHLSTGIEFGIIQKQYNVTCSSCGSTLARVSDLKALQQMQENQVACPSCKTTVSGDSYIDCYVVVDEFTDLLDGSKWMELVVRRELDSYLDRTRALTGVMDGPNEIDLIANIDGDLVLAELKDNRFSIGHAYSFVGKCSQYRPAMPMIVATDGIDEDVKEYISNTGIETTYVPALQDLSTEIQQLLSKQNSKRLSQLVTDIPWSGYVTRSLLASFGVSVPIPDDRISRYLLRREFRTLTP